MGQREPSTPRSGRLKREENLPGKKEAFFVGGLVAGGKREVEGRGDHSALRENSISI